MQKKHFIEKDILYDLYVNQGKSSTKIGKMHGISGGNADQMLRSAGIPMRTKAEAWATPRFLLIQVWILIDVSDYFNAHHVFIYKISQ